MVINSVSFLKSGPQISSAFAINPWDNLLGYMTKIWSLGIVST